MMFNTFLILVNIFHITKQIFLTLLFIVNILIIALRIYELYYINEMDRKRVYPHTNVDVLKNSLLSYAIFILKQKDIDRDFNFNYKTFDGSMLPSFSGYNLENGIMSYMNTPMVEKNKAIDRYLQKTFCTNNDVEIFMIDFIKHVDEKMDEMSKV